MSQKTNTQWTQGFIDQVLLEAHAGATAYSLNKKYGVPKSTVQGWIAKADVEPSEALVEAKETYNEELHELAKKLSLQAATKLQAAVQRENKVGPLLAVFKEATQIYKTAEGQATSIAETRSVGPFSEEVEGQLVTLLQTVNDKIAEQEKIRQDAIEGTAEEIEEHT